MEVKILGKVIGTASGWDEGGDSYLMVYDYSGSISELEETSCFSFDWISGEFELYDEDGEVVAKYGYGILGG